MIEEKFSITEQGYTVGKLLDGTECQILLDTGASKSFMSKPYYLHCKYLHLVPKFTSKMQGIQIGNGQYVNILFVVSNNLLNSTNIVLEISQAFAHCCELLQD